jgi:DNA-binding response OmpR family regulator
MKILVVDDDIALSDVVSFTLRRVGLQVILAHDGQAALDQWQSETPDLVILDVKLPKLDGFSVCKRIRAQSAVPIIMLTVQGDDDEVVKGFELGADDYIVKPFSPRQLVARIKAVMRRTGKVQTSRIVTVGVLRLDTDRREVQVGQSPAQTLTQLENRCLEALMQQPGQVLTAQSLIEWIWGSDNGDRVMLKQLIHRLRQKVESDPTQPHLIETIPGVGYALSNELGEA